MIFVQEQGAEGTPCKAREPRAHPGKLKVAHHRCDGWSQDTQRRPARHHWLWISGILWITVR
ncbi:hypothetical protein ABMZ18_23360 [Escherichia coli]|uniref:hypothetical protein n=1 Tax=Escherichia coli TaxID=562 RepID=UPI0039BEB136